MEHLLFDFEIDHNFEPNQNTIDSNNENDDIYNNNNSIKINKNNQNQFQQDYEIKCKCTNPLKRVEFPVPKFPSFYGNVYEYLEKLELNIKEIEDAINFSNQIEYPHKDSVLDCSICYARKIKYKQLLKQKSKNVKRIKNAIEFEKTMSKKHSFFNLRQSRDDFSLRSSRDSDSTSSSSDNEIFYPRSL